MGWIKKLLQKKEKMTYAEVLNNYAPIYSQFGQNIYASDVVQQAIGCIVREMKKLNPQHIMEENGEPIPINDKLQAVLQNPNELMTTSDFLEKIIWLLYLNYNAFIVPVYEMSGEKRKCKGLYPVAPSSVDFLEDLSGELFIHMRFQNGYETTLDYKDVIHLRYNYSVNEYMGGNEQGQPDNEALLKTLQLNEDMLDGVTRAMRASYAVNAAVKYNTMLDSEETKKALKELEEKLENNKSGFLPMDLKGEYIPITRDIHLIDPETLKFIDEKILRHYGVSLPILTGDYTKAQYEAFYQKTLEPIIISISQGMGKKLFSDRERAYGHKIQLYPKELIFLSTDQTIEVVRILGDAGSMYENEKRVAFGMRPDEALIGKRMQSLNYVDVDFAKEYQIKKGVSKDDK